jgi:predicted PurR-regulated permease PerM
MNSDVESAETESESRGGRGESRFVHFTLGGLFLFALVYALYFGRDFFMPVVLAFLLALMLTPIVRFFGKRGIPSAFSATLLVVLSGIVIGGTGYILSGPAAELVSSAPSIGREVTERLSELRKPFDHLLRASKHIEHLADATDEPGVQKVVVEQPGIISRAAGNLLSIATSIAITFVLSLFLLASGSMFYVKIVQSFATLSQKKRALRIVYDVEREISRYLLTVAVINGGLGLVIAFGLWLLGVPNPLLWGVAAALLNFLPYVGAAMTVVAVAAISLVSFESLAYALIAPAFVLCCNIIEGQFVTPLVLGRRLEINAVAIFIAVAFCSWLWGFVGALIAVPLLVIVKVFCDHFDGLRRFGNFLSAEEPAPGEADATEEAKAG